MAGLILTTNQTMTGAWDAYVIPATPRPYSTALQSRSNVDLLVSYESGGSGYFTLKRGAVLSLDSPNLGGVTIYLQGAIGQVVETIIQRLEP